MTQIVDTEKPRVVLPWRGRHFRIEITQICRMNTDDTDRGHQGSKDTPALEGRHRQDRGSAAFSRQSDSSHTHTRPPHTPQKEKRIKKEKLREKKRFEYSSTESESSHHHFDKYWEWKQSLKKISQIKIWNNCSSANNYSMETVKQYRIGC